MKKTIWHQIALFTAIFASMGETFSIPAPRSITKLRQSDGTQVDVYMKGDEFYHYALSTDGYVLLPDKAGNYRYAVHDTSGNLVPGSFKAVNLNSRSESERRFLKTIAPGMKFSDKQKSSFDAVRIIRKTSMRKNIAASSMSRAGISKTAGVINSYPTTGHVWSVVILVSFSDVAFSTSNANRVFTNMLNMTGYKDNLHIGSVKDYFKLNSSGKFDPEFVVVGPVTLDKKMEYYGANDENGEDVHPAEMVRDACIKADQYVDFSQFDADSDGYVDNVYVFYAGMGEADGGGANTIWPHSWALNGENITLTLDGKKIDEYACSAELKGDGSRTGIGTFTHEYSHVLGLPDLYDVDYETYNGEAFDLGEWSLMAYGAYNGNGAVPPAMSIVERKLLGWASPTVLGNISSGISLPPIDSTNIGYMIKTPDEGEYYLLENRQQRTGSWDYYIPYHGMLIYHVDMRDDASIDVNYNGVDHNWTFAELWEFNMVNAIASHQCVDIEEADDERILYSSLNAAKYAQSLKGDPFPGIDDVRSFTDETTPSMKTWNGTALNKPITDIFENNGLIDFNYNLISPPKSLPASDIGPFCFNANWEKASWATGYYIDVYNLTISNDGDSILTAVPEYENYYVSDTTIKIDNLDDITNYCYRVRGTNGANTSENSAISALTTKKASEIIMYVNDRTIYIKGEDHSSPIVLYDISGRLIFSGIAKSYKVSNRGIYLVKAIIDGKKVYNTVLVK